MNSRAMSFPRCPLLALASALAAGFLLSPASAQIIGGSTLLTNSDVTQLATWLGEGPIQLTNVFSRVTGDGKTSVDFHAAVDGIGRTFSILHVDGYDAIIGGYNPQSWNSTIGYNITPLDPDRTAFVFNLSTDILHEQITGDGVDGPGSRQTFNHVDYGPTFGDGHHIYVGPDLAEGYVNPYSYGGGFNTQNLLGGTGFSDFFTYSTLEVFTISAIPEPSTYAAIFGGLALVGVIGWRARQKRSALPSSYSNSG